MEKDIDLYAALFQAKKIIAKLAKDDEIKYEDDLKMLEQCFEACRPVVAEEIYALCNRIDNLLYLLPETMRNQCGIKSENHPTVFLTGEFSGGKTTLIQEFAKEKSGTTSPIPETANVVVHRCADESSCEIVFNKSFNIEKSEKFREFLRTFNINDSFFNISGNHWEFNKKSVVKSDWMANKIQEFVGKTKDFPEAIEKIIWTHGNCPSYSPLNYVTLVDMPGTGGKDTHEQVISDVYGKENPDIICYLVDTDEGTLAANAEQSIKMIAKKCYDNQIQFYWVYSKPSQGKEQDVYSSIDNSKSWLYGKRKDLNNYIDTIYSDMVDKSEDGQSADYVPQLVDNEYADFLKKAPIIDARNNFSGSSDSSTAHAVNAFAMVIQQYYIKITQRYNESLNNELVKLKIPGVFEEMVAEPKVEYFSKMEKIFENIDDVVKRNFTNLGEIKSAIKKELQIPENEVVGGNPKAKRFLLNLRNKIDRSIDAILDKYTKSGLTAIFSNPEIDLNEFYDKYKKDLEDETRAENLLFFDVQVYHWFKLFYSNQITNSYNKIHSQRLYDKLSAILDELKEYKTNVMYILK